MNKYLIFFLLFLGITTIGAGDKDKQTWTWLHTSYVSCKGFGLTGSYRVNVEAASEVNQDSKRVLKDIVLWVYSAALPKGTEYVNASVTIIKRGKEIQNVGLVRPKNNSMEPQKSDYESLNYYLPDGLELEIPKNAKILFTVSLTIHTKTGSCALGTSKKEYKLY